MGKDNYRCLAKRVAAVIIGASVPWRAAENPWVTGLPGHLFAGCARPGSEGALRTLSVTHSLWAHLAERAPFNPGRSAEGGRCWRQEAVIVFEVMLQPQLQLNSEVC